MATPKRIALFGGTFDPIHQGHLSIATLAKEKLALDQVIFIPCKQSPHKETSPLSSDEDRVQMLKLALQDTPWAKVSSWEILSPPPSYSWKTIEHFKQAHPPETEFFFLIGRDQWQTLPQWSRSEHLSRIVSFIVVGRDGHPQERQGWNAHFLASDHPASSSQIRNALIRKQPPAWLPHEVAQYIESNALYSTKT